LELATALGAKASRMSAQLCISISKKRSTGEEQVFKIKKRSKIAAYNKFTSVISCA
jgi:hypothetical protein